MTHLSVRLTVVAVGALLAAQAWPRAARAPPPPGTPLRLNPVDQFNISLYSGHWFQMYADALEVLSFENASVCDTADCECWWCLTEGVRRYVRSTYHACRARRAVLPLTVCTPPLGGVAHVCPQCGCTHSAHACAQQHP